MWSTHDGDVILVAIVAPRAYNIVKNDHSFLKEKNIRYKIVYYILCLSFQPSKFSADEKPIFLKRTWHLGLIHGFLSL